MNGGLAHKHLQKELEQQSQCRQGQGQIAYLQGLNGSSMTNRGSRESSWMPHLYFLLKLCPFLL